MGTDEKRKESAIGIPGRTAYKYANMDMQKFDAEQMHRILECIMIFETGKISVRYLDGTIVEF